MHTEWRFEQMIPMFRYFCVDPGVGVLQDDVLHGFLIFTLNGCQLARVQCLRQLTKSGDPVFLSSPTIFITCSHLAMLDLSLDFQSLRSGPTRSACQRRTGRKLHLCQ